MTIKTCLLVTDDPDDHLAFSEALKEISEQTTVMIILDSQKALDLITFKKHVPDYIFLDLSTHGIRINTFLKTLHADPKLVSIPIVVYGDQKSFEKVEDKDRVSFFSKDYEYTDLKKFLKEMLPVSMVILMTTKQLVP
jgi:CheY-like chemotaxis protein